MNTRTLIFFLIIFFTISTYVAYVLVWSPAQTIDENNTESLNVNEASGVEKEKIFNESNRVTMGACASAEPESIAKDIINHTEFDANYWRLQNAEEITYMDSFASSAEGNMTADCGYKVIFAGKVDEPEPHSMFNLLRSTMLTKGWVDDMYIKFISDSTGATTSMLLHHADGPAGSTHVFVYPIYEDKSVIFASLHQRQNFENYMQMRNGDVESPCPCSTDVILTVSAPVSLEKELSGIKVD